MANMLNLGDTVNWKGGFGSDPAQPAKVQIIELVEAGSKYGRSVGQVDWERVKEGRTVVVTLDNGSWAYGSQLSELTSN